VPGGGQYAGFPFSTIFGNIVCFPFLEIKLRTPPFDSISLQAMVPLHRLLLHSPYNHRSR
jgi:hypothetical protein